MRRASTVISALTVVSAVVLMARTGRCCDEPAQRQLDLAEQDLEADRSERASAAAASALRLDPGCTQAMFVRGLALHRAGRSDEARALLVTYRDLRGTLALDPRFQLTLALIEASGAPFDAGRALELAAVALVALELDTVEQQLDAAEQAEVVGPAAQRLLELRAQFLWARGDQDAAERTWRRLFSEHPEAAVDAELPPEQLMVMARAQQAVRGATNAPKELGVGPGPWLGLALGGGGVSLVGGVIAGVEHRRGVGLLAGMDTPVGYVLEVDEYDSARRGEQAGLLIGGIGTAALVGGLLGALAHRAERKRLEKKRGASATTEARR